MTERTMGCKLLLLFFGGLTILAFFAMLVNVSESGLRAAMLRKQQKDTKYDLEILADGLKRYAADHGGKLPAMDHPDRTKAGLLPLYVPFDNAFVRMGDNAPHLPNPKFSRKILKNLAGTELIYAEAELPPPAKGAPTVVPTRGFLQADGKVIRLTASEAQDRGWR
ncbi:MAG: hypothetical protein SFU56_07090 [Capsulimonadales bacterium]|nr:hypothetical protein [Capsulimonadales bacterium]